ncbi:MAG: sodium/proline symporter [Chlamydiales bacterium]|nr:sodium/proline symporter [Chlamydiales bacterium]
MISQTFIAFVAYLTILLIIGVSVHKKSSSETDFIMGNRGLNFWLTALSAHASDMSAWLFMGFPMAIFLGGPAHAWIAIGLVLGMFLNWHFVAPRLRRATEHYGAYTLSTYFEKRFNDNSGVIRLLTAVMTLLFMTHYLAAGLIAMGLLLESVFTLDYYLGITLATLVTLTYTFVGGYMTVAWMDLFQGLLLIAVIVLVPVLAYLSLPPEMTITAAAAAQQIPMALIPDYSSEWIVTTFSLAFGWGVGYFGMPHILTKFMGINNPSHMYKAKYLGVSWQIIALGAATAVGLVGIAFFPEGLVNPQLLFVDMVKILFHPLAAGFILCGLLAANMSTMDSQILVCASVISEDLYKSFGGKNASSERLLRVSRGGVVVISLVALLIAYQKQTATVMDTVLYSWAGLGCTFGPLVLMALFFERTNRFGAIAGVAVGGVFAAIWPTLNPLILPYSIAATVPGFCLSLLSIWSVSLLTSPKLAVDTTLPQ